MSRGAEAKRTLRRVHPDQAPEMLGRGGVYAGGEVRREEKAGAGDCAAAKVLRDFGLSAGQAVVKAAVSRRTPKQARGKKYFLGVMKISLDKLVKYDKLCSVEKCNWPRTSSGVFCF